MKNCAFATTTVVNGHGEAIITEVGMSTKVGKIAKLIMSNEMARVFEKNPKFKENYQRLEKYWDLVV